MAFKLVLAVTLLSLVNAEGIVEWNYDHFSPFGPSNWAKHYPDGLGHRQSPINIKTSSRHMKSGANLPPLTFDYTPSSTAAIIKSHYTFTVFFGQSYTNELSGGAHNGERYQLIQMHAHWGGTDRRGSDHAIDQKLYPAELHLVHYNKAKYGTIPEALKHADGLAYLAIFVKLGAHNAEFEKIIKQLPKLMEGQMKPLHGLDFDVRKLLPSSCQCYYAYQGSLTAPPLSEVVVWHVLEDPIEISVDQLHQFRALYCRNYRPIQRQYSRTIISSCMAEPAISKEYYSYINEEDDELEDFGSEFANYYEDPFENIQGHGGFYEGSFHR